MKNIRIDGLDDLRAVAALAVFLGHFYVLMDTTYNISWLPSTVSAFFVHGPIGVDLFYVLSGFFICLAVLKQGFSPRDYIIRRLRRIVPAYYVNILIIITIASPFFFVTFDGLKHVFLHVFFIHNLTPFAHGSINGAYWTLGVEAQFYVLLLLLAPFIRAGVKSFLAIIIAFFVIAVLWRLWSFLTFDSLGRFYFSTQLPGSLDRFAVGMLIAYFLRAGFLGKLRLISPKILMGTIALIPFLVSYSLNFMDKMRGWEMLLPNLFFGLALSILFGGLLICFVLLPTKSILSQGLNKIGLSWVGKISYSFYLMHIPIILSFKPVLIANINGFWNQLGIVFCAVLLTSAASFYLVESRWHQVD